jgi:single-strand DNA-binding protein
MTNVVVLHGRLSRPASEKDLPSGDRVATLELTIPAAGDSANGQKTAESVPLAWFGPPGWVLDLDAGAELVVLGRVRRRFFRGGQGVQSRTEVVVERAAPVRRTARVAELVERAVDAVAARAGDADAPGHGRRRAPATFP